MMSAPNPLNFYRRTIRNSVNRSDVGSMDFGSKFVYAYSDSEEDVVEEEEYEAGIESSNANRSVVAISAPPRSESRAKAKSFMSFLTKSSSKEKKAASSTAPNNAIKGKKWRRADTNVIAVRFEEALVAPGSMHTGEPVVCRGCQAMLSHISKVESGQGQSDKKWACEFCGVMNEVDITSDEIPNQSDVTYMIEPAPCTTGAGRSGTDESLVIFCVDTSGSMCISQEIPGRINLRGSHADRFRSLNTENESQWLPGQRRDVTYITRLQALQAAVDHQLEQLSKDHPTRRAALVTFNSEVTVVGNGRSEVVTIAGDKLNNWDSLVNAGSQVPTPVSIKDSRQALGKKIFDLEEEGQTALGPAMLVSVAMACQVPGSKVIMCTDGMANIGVGNLDISPPAQPPAGTGDVGSTHNDDDEYSKAQEFYRKVSELANSKGVSVSVITIAGTDCKLVELGGVANETGGQVNIVDPMKFTEEFGNILANPVIASHVIATLLVHSRLYIRGESDTVNRVVKEVGNVTKKSEITLEYGVLSKKKYKQRVQKKSKSSEAACNQTSDASAVSAAPIITVSDLGHDNAACADNMMDTAESSDVKPLVDIEPPAEFMDTAAASVNTTGLAASEGSAAVQAAVESSSATGQAAAESTAGQAAAAGSSSTGQAVAGPSAAAAGGSTCGDDSLSELPFQVQIRYTDLDGTQAMRVITQTKPVTRDRKQAEAHLNAPVIGCHASKMSSRLAQVGAYAPSRLNAFAYQNLFARNSESGRTDNLSHYNDLMVPLDREILQAQRTEARAMNSTVSRYESVEESGEGEVLGGGGGRGGGGKSGALVLHAASRSSAASEFSKNRRRFCSDATANAIYQSSSVSSDAFKKNSKKK